MVNLPSWRKFIEPQPIESLLHDLDKYGTSPKLVLFLLFFSKLNSEQTLINKSSILITVAEFFLFSFKFK